MESERKREREGWREGGNKTASKEEGKKQKVPPLVLCHQIERN